VIELDLPLTIDGTHRVTLGNGRAWAAEAFGSVLVVTSSLWLRRFWPSVGVHCILPKEAVCEDL
jgi:hypothetical protein